MNFIEEKVVPYVGEGCCHNRKCQFYRYQYYYKPTEGCLMWAEFQHKEKITQKFGSNFKIHEFMDYASYGERWRCYQTNCHARLEGIHSRALQMCSGHEQFCSFFNIPYTIQQIFESSDITTEFPPKVSTENRISEISEIDSNNFPHLVDFINSQPLVSTHTQRPCCECKMCAIDILSLL